MIVIEKDAELKLLDELKAIRSAPEGKRFVHYAFSQLSGQEKSLVQELLTTQLIDTVMENPHIKAFICEDSDVILVGDNIYSRNFDELTLEIFKLTQFKKMREISNLYDVDNSWPMLYKIAKDKYETIANRAKQVTQVVEQQKTKEEIEAILSGKHLDKAMVSTLRDRRDRRQDVNVMIVEDDAFSRKLIRNILNKSYEVIDVEDGKDALNSYVIIAPDIVFLDIDLPDVNGHQILSSILNIDPEAFVVMLSGNSDQENVIRAIKNGSKGFVTKPFIKDRLFKYIEESVFVKRKNERKKGAI